MSSSFEHLFTLAAAQHYPESTLYVVATPIGNVADISLRALHVLQLVDMIACEDKRNTATLLARYGIDKPLLAAHEHNEQAAAEKILTHLHQGARIAFVSDAGTPAISDPGVRIVTAVRAAGLRVIPLPGASAILTALSVAGSLLEAHGGAFSFIGFLPSKAKQKDTLLRMLANHPYALVMYEVPHRITATLTALSACLPPQRQLLIGRELTKCFEQIVTCTVAEGPGWVDANPNHMRGEFVLMVEGAGTEGVAAYDARQILSLLIAEMPPAKAARIAAALTDLPRQILYEQAIALKHDVS